MILVTTAGKVGAHVALVLAQRGEPVRVLVREPHRAPSLSLARAGVEVVQGDLTVPATIDAAMRGVRTVVLVSPAVPDQEGAVIDSAVRARVEHVVKITSKASADSPVPRRRDQARIEDALTASGIDWTLLRNNAYMQNFLVLAPAIAATDGFGSCTGEGRVGMVDTRDVGAVAAQIASSPAPHAGRTYWPTGPATLSYTDAAAVLSRVLGRTVTHHSLTPSQQEQAMVDVGLPRPLAAVNAQALSLFAQGDADWTTDDVPTVLRRPAGSFEQFATEHASAFS